MKAVEEFLRSNRHLLLNLYFEVESEVWIGAVRQAYSYGREASASGSSPEAAAITAIEAWKRLAKQKGWTK